MAGAAAAEAAEAAKATAAAAAATAPDVGGASAEILEALRLQLDEMKALLEDKEDEVKSLMRAISGQRGIGSDDEDSIGAASSDDCGGGGGGGGGSGGGVVSGFDAPAPATAFAPEELLESDDDDSRAPLQPIPEGDFEEDEHDAADAEDSDDNKEAEEEKAPVSPPKPTPVVAAAGSNDGVLQSALASSLTPRSAARAGVRWADADAAAAGADADAAAADLSLEKVTGGEAASGAASSDDEDDDGDDDA
ncbi:unnamed protein product, partial [Phaeothamnion confervicola]